MFQNIYNLKIRLIKLDSCARSIYKYSEDYRDYLTMQKDHNSLSNSTKRIINVVIYWIIFAIIMVARAVAAIPETLFDVLYWVNYFTFMSYFVFNLIKTHRISNEIDEELMNNLFNMTRISTTMLAFQNSLNSKYTKMVNNLSEEEKVEYEEYLKEHQNEIDYIMGIEYDISDVQNIINEIVTENDNNVSDDKEQEYASETNNYNAANECLDHVATLMTDYLLEETASEISEKDEVEDTDVLKKTL